MYALPNMESKLFQCFPQMHELHELQLYSIGIIPVEIRLALRISLS
jgi:hypothetical protein